MSQKYDQLLCTGRLRDSSISRASTIDEFYSDRSRFLFSSSFRRLQQKAQVFSLESNSSVRTRLTHSLEVSDLGRTLANKIAYRLCEKNLLDYKKIADVVAIVENACLLHDIGNPPFGHFGEIAIRDWAHSPSLKTLMEKICERCKSPKDKEEFINLMSDFYEFDGNPQGFRTITRLHTEYDKYSFNLTYATLLCTLKYSRAAGEKKGKGILKKAGYFQSEKDIVKEICSKTKIESNHRYPLTYIMEAADDIAYCMSDIADGIEKRILTINVFIREFRKEWKNLYGEASLPVEIPNMNNIQFGRDISVPWSKMAMEETVNNFLDNEEEIFNGTADSLISANKSMGRVLETMKSVSRKILYPSFEAESIELTGYAVIMGILKSYERVLALSHDDFWKMVNGEKTDGKDVERRLYNQLGQRYVLAYKYAIGKLNKRRLDYAAKEWWLRLHLIVDHVSGMTDEFALESYQMLKGIKLMQK